MYKVEFLGNQCDHVMILAETTPEWSSAYPGLLSRVFGHPIIPWCPLVTSVHRDHCSYSYMLATDNFKILVSVYQTQGYHLKIT